MGITRPAHGLHDGVYLVQLASHMDRAVEPTKAVGDFVGGRFPDAVVAVPDALEYAIAVQAFQEAVHVRLQCAQGSLQLWHCFSKVNCGEFLSYLKGKTRMWEKQDGANLKYRRPACIL